VGAGGTLRDTGSARVVGASGVSASGVRASGGRVVVLILVGVDSVLDLVDETRHDDSCLWCSCCKSVWVSCRWMKVVELKVQMLVGILKVVVVVYDEEEKITSRWDVLYLI
jgi:hypothetical protein